MSLPQDPLYVVQRWFEEVWNQRRVDVIYELMSPESICHSDVGSLYGPDQFRERHYEPLIAFCPDLWLSVEDTLIEEDQVVIRWEATGAHTGIGLGLNSSGRGFTISGMTWVRVTNGKIAEAWQQSNFSSVLGSLRSTLAVQQQR
ncbi:ester cyclase [Planctomicrobium sp. SH668]|uniref:ester cyclase n=1 Tax=Planctomicrobium sp. SH668 TaxID=3448126 RepID=UPI003F5BA315